MGNKRPARKTRRTWREREVRTGGYTTDKTVDISKVKFPDPTPSAPAKSETESESE